MKGARFLLIATLAALFCLPSFALAAGSDSAPEPVRLTVNLSDAARAIYGVQMTIPVSPGPLTLAYPKWIPGAHAPVGPITHLSGLIITANGKRLEWTRDPVNMYEFHLSVPRGVTSLEVEMKMVGMHNVDPYLADMAWNTVLLYPYGKPATDYRYQANLVLPPDWKYATSLITTGRDGNTVHFATASLYTLVDSPVMAGAYYRKVPLAKSPRVTLDLFADSAYLLTTLTDKDIAAYRKLPAQEYALFGGHHYRHYDFLMALSDYVGNGLEHHESSEDGAGADYYVDPKHLLTGADLLSHEYTHSWNGKFMRPAGLDTPAYQRPMRGRLLWVYEGLTQYLGEVMAARIGLWTKQDYRDQLAYWAAVLDHRPGREWRDLEDTAVAAPLRFRTYRGWANYTRINGIDFYTEGVLLWLDVDTKIRQLSHDKRSLNDFCREFYGRDNGSTATIPYTFDNIVSALDKVQPYDWAKFLRHILDRTGKNAPLAGVTRGGWKLVYTGKQSAYSKAMGQIGLYGGSKHSVSNQMYSIGFKVTDAGKITGVLWNGPAFVAGLAPGMTLAAVNGVAYEPGVLTQAITAAKMDKGPIKLLVKNHSWYATYNVDYHGGLKYPHLKRIKGTPDNLDQIISPLPVK